MNSMQQPAGFWLSPQQAHLWLSHKGAAGSAVCLAMFEGQVEEDRVRQALREAIVRHEVLRTRFNRVPGMKVPFQIIEPAGEPAWESLVEDSIDIDRLFAREKSRDFDQGGARVYA